MIKNDTEQPYQLELYLTDSYLVGAWRTLRESDFSMKFMSASIGISHEPWGGYMRHNIIARRKYNQERQLIEDEFVTENHAIMMYQPLLNAGGRKKMPAYCWRKQEILPDRATRYSRVAEDRS